MGAPKKIYLGDGVSAQFDGWYIWLSTEREDGEHRIALEPANMSELIRLADQVWMRVDSEERSE